MEINLWKVVCVVCALLLNAIGKCQESAGSGEYYFTLSVLLLSLLQVDVLH